MSSIPLTPQSLGRQQIGKPKSKVVRDLQESLIQAALVLCGLFSTLTTATIIVVLAIEASHFFSLEEVSFWDFVLGLEWNPLLGAEKHFGVWPLICGTLLVTGVGMCVSLPLGLITAIYLSEYAPQRLRAVLKPTLEVIAGIPTVVFGFFALTVITPSLRWIHDGFGVYNAFSAGLAVGIMCLPIVCSLSEDALRAVPRSLREAAYGGRGNEI